MASRQESGGDGALGSGSEVRRDRRGRKLTLTPARMAALAQGRRSRWTGNLPKPKSALAEALERLGTTEKVRQTVAEVERLLSGEDLAHIGEADKPSVALFAVAWWAVQECTRDMGRYGAFTDDGRARESARLLPRYLAQAQQYADALGLSPQARAKLGLTRARATAEEELLRALAESAPKPPTVTTLPAGEPEPPGGGPK